MSDTFSPQLHLELTDMPTQHFLRLFIVSFLLFSTLLWWPGEVVAQSKARAGNESERLVLTSEQVLQAMLQMAEAVPKQRKMTAEMVKEVTGLQLKPWPENPKWYSSGGPTPAPQWNYSFSLYPDTSSPALFFRGRFYGKKGIAARDLSYEPICRPTLSEVDRALRKAGYTRGNSFPRRDIHYRNGDISILVLSTFTKTANCVQYLDIYLPDSLSKAGDNE